MGHWLFSVAGRCQLWALGGCFVCGQQSLFVGVEHCLWGLGCCSWGLGCQLWGLGLVRISALFVAAGLSFVGAVVM